MTDKERNEINPEYCAKQLKSIMYKMSNKMSTDELSGIIGAISLLTDKKAEEWME